MEKEAIIQKLKGYMQAKPEVVFVYLYGSHAKGTANRLSDVDVAIYLDEKAVPKDKLFEVRLAFIGELMSLLQTNEIDVVTLNNASPLLSHQVLKYGILLDCKDQTKKNEYVVRSFNVYIDYKMLMTPHLRKLSERIKTGTFGEIR